MCTATCIHVYYYMCTVNVYCYICVLISYEKEAGYKCVYVSVSVCVSGVQRQGEKSGI